MLKIRLTLSPFLVLCSVTHASSHLAVLQSILFFNGGDYLESDGALGLGLDHKWIEGEGERVRLKTNTLVSDSTGLSVYPVSK